MKIPVIALLLIMASCATPYQKHGFTGGFSEELVAKNTYEVTFNGNGYTGRQRVERFLKRRCAELAKENGYTHFIISSNSENDEEKPYNKATIKLINNPSDDIVAYEADLVLKNTAD
jgi:hypothetical protein